MLGPLGPQESALVTSDCLTGSGSAFPYLGNDPGHWRVGTALTVTQGSECTEHVCGRGPLLMPAILCAELQVAPGSHLVSYVEGALEQTLLTSRLCSETLMTQNRLQDHWGRWGRKQMVQKLNTEGEESEGSIDYHTEAAGT